MPAVSPATSRALDPLRFRPLLWMAFCALAGVTAGGVWTQSCGIATRADARWLWPLLPSFFVAFGVWKFRRCGLKRRACIAIALFFFFMASAARRIAAPAGDVSLLTQIPARLDGPLLPTSLTVRGVVADYPKNSDFSTQFPLQCTSHSGRIWVSAPFGTRLEIGDEISLQLEVSALPRPGNPGERDTFWRNIGANCWCLGRKPTNLQKMGVNGSYFAARRIGKWRDGLLHHYEAQFRGAGDQNSLRWRPFPAANAQLLTAMVFGEGGLSRPLPQTLRDDFRAAGLSHVLVASGTQISFVLAITLGILGRLGFKQSKWLLLAIPILIFYAFLAGSATSIWRATLAGFLLIYAILLGRDVDGLSLWSGAMLALLILDPLTAWSLSFQLTFAATWGLFVVAPALSRLFERRFGKGKALDLAAFSLGAQAATIPISLFHFGTFSAAGLGANFVAVPLAGFMVATGLLGLVCSPINWLNYFLTRGVASVAHGFALLPGARLSGSPLSLAWSLACYALLLAAIAPLSLDFAPLLEAWQQSKAKLSRFFVDLRPQALIALFLVLGLWLMWLSRDAKSGELRVTMLDVGQGESILVRTPSGQNILIDGGSLDGRERSDIGAQVIVPALQSLGVEQLDLLVLTHSDADHCNGLSALAREIPVRAFLDGPSVNQNGKTENLDPALTDYFALRKLLDSQKIPVITPRAGQFFRFGDLKLRLLAPIFPLLDSVNDDAIVCRLEWGKTSILLTGDIEKSGEARLLSRGANLKCTVLKVAHHGSKTSTTPAFLRAAKPALALISCGRYNRFGHPNPQTLRTLQDAKVPTFRTDLSGALEVDCDKNSCRVTPFR
ncbi:competence protein ComEC [Abditibacterium utsteinense]|uniref:Competence protein ComEC n=1 Tax=Abditibacterium utsteinense TaxID=1960156 RepID=A0A2S8SVM7_9BACT|nr:DNA internalization-related competence protein ComEC/Rec2 [Abditibacterium utsteinense]PQV64847.1 competence protein ComEC [Abditibacterium utsteinense]